jgi:ribosomal protein S18 acetylase RimI-like enzyme
MIWFAVENRRPSDSYAWIYDFRIDEQHRRHGYGYQAMLAVEAKVRALGLNKIGLHVFGHNHAAQALYEKAGYGVTGISMAKQI